MDEHIYEDPDGSRVDPINILNVRRWTEAVLRGLQSPSDPRNLQEWAREAAIGRGTLRARCYAVRVQPKRALDLVRVLRVVHRYRNTDQGPLYWLDCADQRTLTRLLRRGNLKESTFGAAASDVDVFLSCQRFVTSDTLVTALTHELRSIASGRGEIRHF
jgi:hypothetical protein